MATALATFLKTSMEQIVAGFGEAVTYKPSGGDNRSISAVIERGTLAKLDGGQAYAANGPEMVIRVVNDATTGITAAEVNTGKDLVSLPVRIGQSATDRLITKILAQDDGQLVLEVR